VASAADEMRETTGHGANRPGCLHVRSARQASIVDRAEAKP